VALTHKNENSINKIHQTRLLLKLMFKEQNIFIIFTTETMWTDKRTQQINAKTNKRTNVDMKFLVCRVDATFGQ